jgi:hypothetical protein
MTGEAAALAHQPGADSWLRYARDRINTPRDMPIWSSRSAVHARPIPRSFARRARSHCPGPSFAPPPFRCFPLSRLPPLQFISDGCAQPSRPQQHSLARARESPSLPDTAATKTRAPSGRVESGPLCQFQVQLEQYLAITLHRRSLSAFDAVCTRCARGVHAVCTRCARDRYNIPVSPGGQWWWAELYLTSPASNVDISYLIILWQCTVLPRWRWPLCWIRDVWPTQ